MDPTKAVNDAAAALSGLLAKESEILEKLQTRYTEKRENLGFTAMHDWALTMVNGLEVDAAEVNNLRIHLLEELAVLKAATVDKRLQVLIVAIEQRINLAVKPAQH